MTIPAERKPHKSILLKFTECLKTAVYLFLQRNDIKNEKYLKYWADEKAR